MSLVLEAFKTIRLALQLTSLALLNSLVYTAIQELSSGVPGL